MKINIKYLKSEGKHVLDKILIFSKDNKNNILIVIGAIVCALIVTLFVPTSGIDASKEAQQLQSLSSNIRKHYRNRPDYWGLDAKAAINMQIVPLDMLKDHQITSIWNTPILIGAAPEGNILMPGSRSFDVIYKHLDKKQCVVYFMNMNKEQTRARFIKIKGLDKTKFYFFISNTCFITD